LNGCFEKLERLGVEIKENREREREKEKGYWDKLKGSFATHDAPEWRGHQRDLNIVRQHHTHHSKWSCSIFFNNILFIKIPNYSSMHLIITRKHDEKTKNPLCVSLFLFLLLG
jgi:hypothetical protein